MSPATLYGESGAGLIGTVRCWHRLQRVSQKARRASRGTSIQSTNSIFGSYKLMHEPSSIVACLSAGPFEFLNAPKAVYSLVNRIVQETELEIREREQRTFFRLELDANRDSQSPRRFRVNETVASLIVSLMRLRTLSFTVGDAELGKDSVRVADSPT